jgi:hypothetical protein
MVPAIRLSSYQNPILECTARPAHSQPLPTTGATTEWGGGASPPKPEGWKGNLYPLIEQGPSQSGGRASPPKPEGWKGSLYPLTEQRPSQNGGAFPPKQEVWKGNLLSLASHKTGAIMKGGASAPEPEVIKEGWEGNLDPHLNMDHHRMGYM